MKRYIRSSTQSGYVGIWWYADNNHLYTKMKSLDDAEEDGPYLQYSRTENHASLWKQTILDNVPDVNTANSMIAKGYKSIQRGRVIYDIRSHSYIVTCSNEMLNNIEFKQAIIETFNLPASLTDFEALSHYHIVEITGNPAIDKFEYDI